ncbi:hypothetical protein [Methanosarcina horonobensis]|nr:hypothetical protein [Methanosarcina horonobensis]
MTDLTFSPFLKKLILALTNVVAYAFGINKPIIKIKSINLGLGGERGLDDEGELDEEWKCTISSISVEVCNKGHRDALNCEGLVTFKKLDPLALHPTMKGDVLHNTTKFDLLAGETKSLDAAWGFSRTAIDRFTELNKGDFLDKALPIEVVIFYREKTVRKRLKEKDADRFIRQFEEQLDRGN